MARFLRCSSAKGIGWLGSTIKGATGPRRAPAHRRAQWDEVSHWRRPPLLGEVALTTNPTQVEAPLAALHFKQSIAILQQIKAENELALAYAGYGRLHQQQGNISQARDYLTRALEIFNRLGTLLE